MGRRQGRFIKLKVENMQEQHDNIIEKEEEEKMAEHKKYAIITVAPGDGIKKMFTELRADIVVGGGQTMNPSTKVECRSYLHFTEQLKYCFSC